MSNWGGSIYEKQQHKGIECCLLYTSFRASITESQRGAGLAEYAYSVLNSRKIATISIRNDSSNTALLKGFNSKLSELETAAAGDAQSEPTSSIVYKEDINIEMCIRDRP